VTGTKVPWTRLASLSRFFARLSVASAAWLSGALHAQSLPEGVSSLDYRRAWPTRAAVLEPDPVLGKERFWEGWVYSKAFAERFHGFDPAHAEPDMNPDVHAIVFRTYKEKVFDYRPEMFRCEYEIYFDARVHIPLGDLDAPNIPYPPGVSFGFERLRAVREEDAKSLAKAHAESKASRSEPLILADGKLDGRHARFGLTYFPVVVPGISAVKLGRGGSQCEVLAPKRPGSRYWIWLFGELSFDRRSGQPHRYGAEFSKWLMDGTFDPGPLGQALGKGFVRMPEAFYARLLPKVTLIKALNQCISYRAGYEQGFIKDVDGSRAKAFAACAEVEGKGEIHEIGLRGVVKGWHKVGF
jgi:hypothetical protein